MSKVSVLSNGIKVATLNNGVKAAQVGIFSNQGSGREHVDFTGKYNLLSTAVGIANPTIQAKTTRANTTFKTYAANASAGLASLHNGLSASFSSVIDQAKAQAQADNDALDYDYWELSKEYALRTGYQGEALGAPVQGTPATINSTSADELADKANNLARTGMVIAAVGNVDHDSFVADCEAKFSHQIVGGGNKNDQLFTGSFLTHRFDSLFSCYTTIIQQIPELGHRDHMPLKVASAIIGSFDRGFEYNTHSPKNLNRRFSIESDIKVTKTKCWVETFGNNGIFGYTFHVDSDGQEIDWARIRIQNQIASLKKRSTEFGVTMAKNDILMQTASALQHQPLETLGESVLATGAPTTVASTKASLNSVSLNGLQEAADTWLFDQELAVGAVGCTEVMGGSAYSLRAGTAFQQVA